MSTSASMNAKHERALKAIVDAYPLEVVLRAVKKSNVFKAQRLAQELGACFTADSEAQVMVVGPEGENLRTLKGMLK